MRNYWMPDYTEAARVQGRIRADIQLQPKKKYDIRFLIYEMPDNMFRVYWRQMTDPESGRELFAYCQAKTGSYPATVKEAEEIPGAMEIVNRIFPQQEYILTEDEKNNFKKILRYKLPFRIRVPEQEQDCSYAFVIYQNTDTVRYNTDVFPAAWNPLRQLAESLVWAADLNYTEYMPRKTSFTDGKEYTTKICGTLERKGLSETWTM